MKSLLVTQNDHSYTYTLKFVNWSNLNPLQELLYTLYTLPFQFLTSYLCCLLYGNCSSLNVSRVLHVVLPWA